MSTSVLYLEKFQIYHDEDEEKTFEPPSNTAERPAPFQPDDPLLQERFDRIARVFALSRPITQAKCFNAVFAACKARKWSQIKEIETECDSIVNTKGRSILLEAFEQGEIELAEALIEKKIALHTPDREGNYALHYAIKTGCRSLLPSLWEHLDINERNHYQQTPLHLAAERGDPQDIHDLIANGGRVNTGARFTIVGTLFEGVTPLHIAVIYDHRSCMDILLQNAIERANPFIDLPQIGNLLHIAIHFGQRYALMHLLTAYFELTKDLINKPNQEGRTPVMEAAFQGEGEAIVLLKTKGASLEASDMEKRTALHWAAIGRQHNSANLLCYYECDLNAADCNYNRPFDLLRDYRDPTSKSMSNHLKNLAGQERLRECPSPYAVYLPENLVFKGGGPKGIAYVGALKALERENALRDLVRVAGTSAGAINATFMACGYNAEEIEVILKQTNLMSFLDHPLTKKKIKKALKHFGFSKAIQEIYNLYQIARETAHNPLGLVVNELKKLWGMTGLCEGEEFREWIEERVQEKTHIEYCTFGELASLVEHGKPFKHLHVFTTRIGNIQLQQINSEDPQWEDVIISDAVRASMSIPGVFNPHTLHRKINGARIEASDFGTYVDGGLIRNFPIDAFDKRKFLPYNPQTRKENHALNRRTLGLSLYSPQDKKWIVDKRIETVGALLRSILSIYSQAEELIQDQIFDNQERTIPIDNRGVGTLEFHLSEQKQKELIASGEQAVNNFYAKQKELTRVEGSSWIAHIVQQATYGTNIETLPVDFLERTPYLKELSQRFLQEILPLSRVILWGPPGRGKTSVAIDFANRNIEKFSLIWQINCGNDLRMLKDYQDLAKVLGMSYKEDDPLDLLQRRVHGHLERKEEEKPYLLIYDNVEKAPLLPKRGGCLLITTRQKGNWRENDCIEVKIFAPNEAIDLLTSIIKPQKYSVKAIGILCEELGYLPAAITQIGRYIIATPGITPENFLKTLEIQKNTLKHAMPDDHYPLSITASWKIIHDDLEKFSPLSLRWLQCCAFLSPDPIPIDWLRRWLQEDNIRVGISESGEILRPLLDKGLIHYDRSQETLLLHRLRQHLCQTFMAAETRGDIIANALQLLDDIIKNLDFKLFSNSADIACWASHAESLLLQDLDPSLKQSNLLDYLGLWKYHTGKYQESLHYHEAALVIDKKIIDYENPYLAASLERIGICLADLGQHGKARVKHEEALTIRKRTLGEKHPDVSASLNSIGNCLFGLRQYKEALAKYKSALSILKHTLPEHPDVPAILGNIGNCLSKFGLYGEALEKHEAALTISKRILGKEHFEVADSLDKIGIRLSDLRQHKEALQKHKEALTIRERTLGEEHPKVGLSLSNVATCLSKLGHHREALEKYKEALSIHKQALGDEHPKVALCLNNIGACLYELGEYKEALVNCKQAFIVACCYFKQEHPDIIFYLESVVQCLKKINEQDIHEKTKEELLPFCIELLGNDHQTTRSLLNVKADICLIQ